MSWFTIIVLMVVGFVLRRGLLYVLELKHKVRMLEIDKEYSDTMYQECVKHIAACDALLRMAAAKLADLEFRAELLGGQTSDQSQFTKEELQSMRHYLHPDKHRGKTTDLVTKLNGLLDE